MRYIYVLLIIYWMMQHLDNNSFIKKITNLLIIFIGILSILFSVNKFFYKFQKYTERNS